MLEEVYKWIQNIAVYLVVVTAMLHAVPGKDYERYIRFFSGLVLIVLHYSSKRPKAIIQTPALS